VTVCVERIQFVFGLLFTFPGVPRLSTRPFQKKKFETCKLMLLCVCVYVSVSFKHNLDATGATVGMRIVSMDELLSSPSLSKLHEKEATHSKYKSE